MFLAISLTATMAATRVWQVWCCHIGGQTSYTAELKGLQWRAAQAWEHLYMSTQQQVLIFAISVGSTVGHCGKQAYSCFKCRRVWCVWGAETRTEQSCAHRVSRHSTVRNKTAELIRVSDRIAAGAGRVSVSSSRTIQRGGSMWEQGLEPASST